jgi:hypothetical protein
MSNPQSAMWKTYPHFPHFSCIKIATFPKILLFCEKPPKIIHNSAKMAVEKSVLSTFYKKQGGCILSINA